MSIIIKPADYHSPLDPKQTEQGIMLIKEFFQQNLSTELRLRRVTAPLFVLKGLGINDDLNGVERPVTFPIKDLGEAKAEVVHSLAKWKRLTLAEYEVEPGYGIYTDMNAIRADEELDNLHSLYVDQWDWEAVIKESDRNINYLKQVVRRIYAAILRTEFLVCERYETIKPFLPREIFFIHSEDLLAMYPDKDVKERENLIAKKYGAVFVIGIGGKLSNGEPHDGRAPDYDDWTTPGENGKLGLNGDILIWYPVLERAVELSSMGIRVDKESLLRQLKISGQEERQHLYFHQQLLTDQLPLSVGGGIGQSRLCMVLLHKAHIGEIQASIWPEKMVAECKTMGINII
ncbi:MAG: aspartate--ammonia ligase [Prevotella sp.]|nr:aspartate--ammonia ligase [Prevotella sp.]